MVYVTTTTTNYLELDDNTNFNTYNPGDDIDQVLVYNNCNTDAGGKLFDIKSYSNKKNTVSQAKLSKLVNKKN